MTAHATGIFLARAILALRSCEDEYIGECFAAAELYLSDGDQESQDALKAIIEYYKA